VKKNLQITVAAPGEGPGRATAPSKFVLAPFDRLTTREKKIL